MPGAPQPRPPAPVGSSPPHPLFSQPFPTPSLEQQHRTQHTTSYFSPAAAPDSNGDDPPFPPPADSTPSSPLSSSPFSLRSHKLREAQQGRDLFALAHGGDSAGGGAAGTPYFEAVEGEALFGPQPGSGTRGWENALASPVASPVVSPAASVRAASIGRGKGGGATSPEERKRLREKYALGREEEEKLGRLLGAVYGRMGAASGSGTRDPKLNTTSTPPNGRPPPAITSPTALFTPTHLSLPDSPPSTTSSRKTRRREQVQTIETVLASAESSPSPPPTSAFPPVEFSEVQPNTPTTTRDHSSSDRFFTPPEHGPTDQSPLQPHPPPPSTGTPHRSPRSPFPLWQDDFSTRLQTTTPLDSPRPLSSRSAYSPPRSASTPPLGPAYNPFPANTSPVVSPPTSPPAERSLTPFPTPPPEDLPTSFPDPFFRRPATHRTLGYDYLPSRSGVRASNSRPRVDSEMGEEERQWVERTRRVVNDGGLRDWWGFPVGERGQWGRAVLSPIVTETEPTHTSPSTSSLRSPYSPRYQSFSVVPPSPITRPRSAGAYSSRSPPLRAVPVSTFSSSSLTSPASGGLPSPRHSPRKKRDLPSSPLASGMVLGAPDEPHHLHASPSSFAHSASPAPSVEPPVPGAFRNAPPSQSHSHSHYSRSTGGRTRVGGGDEPQRPPSLWTERDGATAVRRLDDASPPLEALANAARSTGTRRSGEPERERRASGTSPSVKSSKADAISDWARRVEPGSSAEEKGSPSSAASPGREKTRTGVVTAVPRNAEAYSNAVGMGSERASVLEWRKSLVEEKTDSSSSPRRHSHRESPSSRSPPSPTKHSIPRSSSPAAAAANLPDPSAPRRPSGRSSDDIAAWARGAGGGAEREAPTPSIEARRSLGKETSSAGRSPSSPRRTVASSAQRAGPDGPDLGGDGGQLSMDALLSSPPTSSNPARFSREGPFSPPPPSASPVGTRATSGPRSAFSRFEQDPAWSFADATRAPSSLGGADVDQRVREARPSTGVQQAGMADGAFFSGAGDGVFSPVSFPPGDAFSAPPSTDALRGPLRPYRRGPYPVPELSEEEKAARRALRKSGRSPEFELPVEETKSEMRKRAWKEQQRFEKEKLHLLQMLGDPPSRSDIPVYNALAHLHLSTSVPASRDLAEHFLVSSLSFDETQPEIAHLLALHLEERDLLEAIHWHRIALRYGVDQPEYHLSLAAALSRSNDLDAALDAYTGLSRGFPQTPYEALALYHIGRLYHDCGRPEERPNVAEAYRSALEVLQGLRLLEPSRRRGERWEELDELERVVLESLAEVERARSGVSTPAARSGGAPSFASPATLRRPVSSASANFDHFRSPPAPSLAGPASSPRAASPHHAPAITPSSQVTSAARTGPSPSSAPHPSGAPPRGGFPSSRPSSSSSAVSPRTLDTIISSLRHMASSTAASDLARSKQQLADDVEEALAAFKEAARGEKERGEEVRRELEELERELGRLPDRLVSTAKLVSSRPPSARPPPPSYARDPLSDALDKIERARERLGIR
ncbi:hypothetical protein JCM6882_003752 [Rhodosporidiobolus microsporus]